MQQPYVGLVRTVAEQKRATWASIQRTMPEFAALMTELAKIDPRAISAVRHSTPAEAGEPTGAVMTDEAMAAWRSVAERRKRR